MPDASESAGQAIPGGAPVCLADRVQVGTPALRAAAQAFKQEPSVASLVPVAAFLDKLGILVW